MNIKDINKTINFAKIYNLDLPRLYRLNLKFLKKEIKSLDWQSILPDHFLEEFYNDINSVKDRLDDLDKDFNFLKRYDLYENFLNNLVEPKIDILAYKAFLEIENNETVKSSIKSFKPVNSFASKIEYTNNTVTGRLTVKEGPRILTLPKRCRNILKSSFLNGKIVSVDFCNLEPRLALHLLDKSNNEDIYEYFRDKVSFNVDRSVIKRAVISILYGAKSNNLADLTRARSEEVFNMLKSYFNISKLLNIAESKKNNSFRRNYFGRPLHNIKEIKENIIVNNYIQSTAVDISLKCFSELSSIIDKNLCKPLYVLHDAIIFDVNNDYIKELNIIIDKGYLEKGLGYFPLSIEDFIWRYIMKNKSSFLHQVAANYIVGNDIEAELSGERIQLETFQNLLDASKKLRESLYKENSLDRVLELADQKKFFTKKFQDLTGIEWKL